MGLELIPAYGRQEEIMTLFTEYTDMLMEADPTVRQYLILQHYEKELERPESKYGMPEGRLYLAYWDGRLAGCIGLRKLDEERGELKRLYVRSDFRGHQIGEQLIHGQHPNRERHGVAQIRRIFDDAREIGYRHVLLDTLPFLHSAIRLYRKIGFYEIDCYNNSPMETTIFLQYDL